MLNKFYIFTSILLIISLTGCGEVTTSPPTEGKNTPSPITSVHDDDTPLPSSSPTPLPSSSPTSIPSSTPTPTKKETVSISGTISYEKPTIVHRRGTSSLDFSILKKELAKKINVRLIDSTGAIVASTSTDQQGKYKFIDLPKNSKYKIRVYAKMVKSSAWDVKVIDNTNGGAVYVIEGALSSTGETNTIRNLTASATNKGAPPFAILNSIYNAMEKVRLADANILFPPLKINWSVNNIETGTYYDGVDNIFISGDQKGDSDEYDNHIIIHEWGHYFENKFSRADNIGGQHGSDEYLDIRVAFGEGFGNAFSAIVTDDPVYFDTVGNSGWNMNIESAVNSNQGWFSETSIQKILYDLYDSDNDGADTLALGFQPLYNIFVGKQKITPAFTSIFPFIYALKDENPESITQIDDILQSEKIAPINDIYGEDRTAKVNNHTLPLYRTVDIGGRINICSTSTYGARRFPGNNKLNHHKYVNFTIDSKREYTIKVQQSNGRSADPDFILFKTSPFENIIASEEEGTETHSITLEKGQYLLDISDASNVSLGCFDVTIN